MLESALNYAKRGWYVAPVLPGAKHPYIKWATESTINEDQIRYWWNRNPGSSIAVITGEKSGIVVMDIDPRSGGHESLFEKCAEHGPLPDTLTFKTGGGGTHYVFKHPGYKVKTTSNIFPGMDSKGDGGLIIAPPSPHSSGGFYEVMRDFPIADMPEWWAKEVKDKEPVKGVKVLTTKPFPKEKYLVSDAIPKGDRNDSLYRIACAGRAYGLDRDELYTFLSEVNDMRCNPALKDAELLGIAESAATKEPGFIRAEELDLPVPGLNRPTNYRVCTDGIHYTNTKGETKKTFPIPVAITRRLKNVDTGIEKIELSFYRNNEWFSIIVSRSTAFNNSKIIDLSDQSLPVSSSNVKDLVKYLTAFESANLEMIPEKCVSRLGWVGSDRFLPGLDEGIHLDAPHEYKKGHVRSGGVSEWVENVQPILDFDIARFMLASSFAAPLLKLLKKRSFIVYVYGSSRGGKTASVKTALSVWGDPVATMLQFDSTPNSIMARAAFNSHIPIGIDERQTLVNQAIAERLIYTLANGQPKRKLNKDSTPQSSSSWQTIIITTGEDSLTTDSTREGVYSRSIELFGVPIPDPKIASKMHNRSEEVYGVAGPLFIQHILTIGNLKEELEQIEAFLEDECPENIESHVGSVAIIVLADMYMHHLFFKERKNDSLELGVRILAELQDKESLNEDKRAYNELMSWVAANQNSFNSLSKEVSGWIDGEYIYFYPTVFKKVMKELGFNERKIKRGWADKGLMRTETRGGKLRYSYRVTPSAEGSSRTEMIVVKKE